MGIHTEPEGRRLEACWDRAMDRTCDKSNDRPADEGAQNERDTSAIRFFTLARKTSNSSSYEEMLLELENEQKDNARLERDNVRLSKLAKAAAGDDKLKRENAALKADKAKLVALVKKQAEDGIGKDARIARLEAEKTAAARAALQAGIDDLKAKVAELSAEKVDLTEQIDELKARVAEVQAGGISADMASINETLVLDVNERIKRQELTDKGHADVPSNVEKQMAQYRRSRPGDKEA